MFCDCLQVFVYGNDLYIQSGPLQDATRLTNNGDLLYYFNGIPDWLYEGKNNDDSNQ